MRDINLFYFKIIESSAGGIIREETLLAHLFELLTHFGDEGFGDQHEHAGNNQQYQQILNHGLARRALREGSAEKLL